MFDKLPERPFFLTEKAFPSEPGFLWQDAHMCKAAHTHQGDLQETVISTLLKSCFFSRT